MVDNKNLSLRTRIKICGLTNLDDALASVQFGADALGFVFFKKSPRAIDLHHAQSIMEKLPAFIEKVGLFVNADSDFVHSAINQTDLSLLQFHGDETPEFCEQFEMPYIKAIRVKDNIDLDEEVIRFKSARNILLDAYDPDLMGGTGKQFDWGRIPEALASVIILAGGLTPENIQQAIQTVRPYAVDVSGGVEENHAIKSQEKIQSFIHNVQLADQQNY